MLKVFFRQYSFVFLFWSFVAGAQPYGQYKYSHPGAFLTSAFRTSINSQGHLLAGFKPNIVAGTFNFCIDKIAPGGGFSTSAHPFSVEYKYSNTASCGTVTGSSQILNCSGVSVIETNVPGSPKAWYAMAGTFDEGCFFATMDSTGLPINSKAYMFPYANPVSNAKTYIAESATPGNYYLCGTHDSTIYVLKVNSAGAIAWSGYYYMGTTYFSASGIMECPFTGKLVIIGSGNTPISYSTATDGFILKLDPNTGNVSSYKTYTIPSGACQQFSSIKPAFSATGGKGYIIGGYTDSYAAQPWMLKVDTAGSVVWSTVLFPSTDPASSAVTDVVERQVGSTYEYYGVVKSMAAGMIVLKLDDNGIPVPADNEFKFNPSSTIISSGCNLDFENTGPNIALTTYGTADGINGGEFYMVRSYFNGKSGCNETQTVIPSYYAGPNMVITPWITRFGSLSVCNMFQLNGIKVTTAPIMLCSTVTVNGGSNGGVTSITDDAPVKAQISVYPNPFSSLLEVVAEGDINERIIVYNSLGKLIRSESFLKGQRKLQIDLSSEAAGIYFIQTGSLIQKVIKIRSE